MVEEVRLEHPRIGTRKLYYLLHSELRALGVGRDRLFNILRTNHMLIKPKKRYHLTTNSFHRFKKHSNLIEGKVPQKPEQVWVADITYVGTRDNPMYLSLITDAYSKKIMGYSLSKTLETKGSIKALRKALNNRQHHPNTLIHHSDRGVQYCSDSYQRVIQLKNIQCSMTESYDPYQNAIAERVNGILKQEYLDFFRVKDFNIMKKLIDESVERYNNKRPHWSCHLLTPEQMHNQDKLKILTYKNEKSKGEVPSGF